MRSSVLNPIMAAGIEATDAGLDVLLHDGADPTNVRDAIACIAEFERLRRRIDAASIELLDQIDRRGLHRPDGHGTAKIMVRHVGNLSPGEAAARSKAARMLRDLPDVALAHSRGEIGVEHLRLLARVHSNRRVRQHMTSRQKRFIQQATQRFVDFEAAVRRWERLVDQDGPNPPADANHENRNVSMLQEFNLSWNLSGSYGSMQGASIAEIFNHYINTETTADWEKARAEHGDQTCNDHLSRTIGQRRADALWQIFQDAASNPNSAVPISYVHNIVWNQETFEHHLSKLFGGDPEPLDDDLHKCHTLAGIPIDPTEAIASTLLSKVRRVVLGADSAVIDLGIARFFTGNARHAVQLQHTHCVWPGCCVPVTDCEADHLVEHSRGGRTNPGNGAPLCGKHNRWKQKGFTIWRDQAGKWHTIRPDGTEIT